MGSLSAVDSPLAYPKARRDESVVDNYHGVSIPDPYRWLEDPDSEESKEYVRRQVELTESVLKTCEARESIRERITALFDHPRYTPPFKRGLRYFYFHNTGLQPQDVLYVQDSLEGEAEVLLDPNSLSDDGTVSLNICSVSEDGDYVAYGLSSSGSDWITIKVMHVTNKTIEPDSISWVKFSSIAWTHDTKGFFYSRYSAPKEGEITDGTETNVNLDHQLYYHFLGTDQSDDILCWRDPNYPKYIYSAAVTEDGKYVILYIEEGCEINKKVYYLDLSSLPNGLHIYNQTLPFTKFIDKFEASYNVISNDDNIFTFLTNKDAPKYKLARVDLNFPSEWFDVVREHEKDVLVSAHAINQNKLLVRYLSDVKYVLQVRDLENGTLIHPLPLDIGTIHGISTRRKENIVFVGFSSFLTPGIIYHCDLRTQIPNMKIFREIVVPNFDRSEFRVEQAFVPSKDGTKIPVFIVARKDVILDGSHPCLLYGYGGFSVSVTPSFSVSRVILLKHLNAVFSIANIRGGGEYGEEWHKAGSLARKQNCFDDFISAAEYLISTGYTQPTKLCIEGGSNGGLLVGACINQRPELFGCALAHVGVMDMLRFHKFTIGHAWTCDFGCSDKEEEFNWLIKYSPLHNVRRPWEQSSQYPATMLLTADHDNRVVPLHSLKLLATMQHVLCTSVERSPQTNPIVGRIETKAGHGSGRPTQKLCYESASTWMLVKEGGHLLQQEAQRDSVVAQVQAQWVALIFSAPWLAILWPLYVPNKSKSLAETSNLLFKALASLFIIVFLSPPQCVPSPPPISLCSIRFHGGTNPSSMITTAFRFPIHIDDPDSEETKEFVENQVKLTESVLSQCETREKLKEKLTKLFDYQRYSSPFKRGDKYFYFHNTGLQAQSVLYVQDSLDGKPEVLLDPNELSEDGTVALNTYSVSENAKHFAYGLSASGSDWVTIKVMQIDDKKIEPDTLSWVKFSGITWTHDSKGFFYSRYPPPNEEISDAGTETHANINQELYYHFLGTDQSQDILCWKDPENPKHSFSADVTDDGKYLLLYTSESCNVANKFYYLDLSALPNGLETFREGNELLPFTKFVDAFEACYEAVANDGTVFTFRTNKDAPRYKLVRVDLKESNVWSDVIPESGKDVLESASAVNSDQLLVCYLNDVKNDLQLRDLGTGSLQHHLPLDIGTVKEISGRRKDAVVFIGFTSFLTPGIIYQCDLKSGAPDMKIFRETIVSNFNRSEFQVDQVFVPSKDGTKIPMFIVSRKGITLDGSNPCLLYGYGGFNISITPSFSVYRNVLLQNLGGIFCIANIRGGGEYGEEWHKAGSLAQKQNCFDDFIAAAEYLISAGYTQTKKLCIEGGSNGGLLVGACINQRPDLYGCALAHVGVMDMLRFHKFTIGHAWTSDYGCSEKEEEFQWLIKYSPLHNVRRPWEQSPDKHYQYPSTMLLTADHDDRVVPLHSLKLLATMQHVLCTSVEGSPQTNPIVGRIESKAGHGAGLPTQKIIEEAADRYSFMAKMVGATWTEE
ncbi:hypothetical protein V2J09_017302 [Rumex salicifolius]